MLVYLFRDYFLLCISSKLLVHLIFWGDPKSSDLFGSGSSPHLQPTNDLPSTVPLRPDCFEALFAISQGYNLIVVIMLTVNLACRLPNLPIKSEQMMPSVNG